MFVLRHHRTLRPLFESRSFYMRSTLPRSSNSPSEPPGDPQQSVGSHDPCPDQERQIASWLAPVEREGPERQRPGLLAAAGGCSERQPPVDPSQPPSILL